MKRKYTNLIKYDEPFTDNIIKRGIEIFLNNKVSIEQQNNNSYLSYITGTNTYEVEVSFNDNEELTNWSCDCPFFIDNGFCKHTYALISKIKLDYDYENIDAEIRKYLKQLKKKSKSFYRNDKVLYKHYERLYNDYQNTKTLLENIMLLKEIYYYNDIADKDIEKERINKTNTQIEEYEYSKGPGLFSLFFTALDSINKQQEENNKWYEEEKKRYRDAIVEQNLYNGKKYEDLYDELNGDIKK